MPIPLEPLRIQTKSWLYEFGSTQADCYRLLTINGENAGMVQLVGSHEPQSHQYDCVRVERLLKAGYTLVVVPQNGIPLTGDQTIVAIEVARWEQVNET